MNEINLSMKPVAIVTGAASNIGLAIARRFKDDYHVLGLDLKFGLTQQDSAGFDFEVRRCDITNQDDLLSAFEYARSIGQIAAVVHSAAISEPRISIKQLSYESWEKVLKINLTGTFLLMKTSASYLEESKGAAVFISSRAGKAGFAGFDPTPVGTKAHYCASKAGVISLVKSFAIELSPSGARVNGIAPGSIEGEMIPRELWAELSKKIPLGRLGRADEVAETARFLCSPAASYITGHILDVNGGTLMD